MEVRHRGLLLYRYVHRPATAPLESPRPYFHPVQTLAGDVVTGFRPPDHAWHHGLSMTASYLSGHNFWGGPTYVRGQGYVQLPNNGRVEHTGWDRLDPAHLAERLRWLTIGGDVLLDEHREIRIGHVSRENGSWRLHLTFRLTNVTGDELCFGSPVTQGKPAGGYGSLFWRGPRDFENCTIFDRETVLNDAAMGRAAPWLALTAKQNGSHNHTTIVLIDDPANLRHPTMWFARSRRYGCASFSFMYQEPYRLPAGQTLTLNYRLLIATGAWTPTETATAVAMAGPELGRQRGAAL